MALIPNQLYAGPTTRGPLARMQPSEGPGAVRVGVFISASDTLPVGTPICVVPASGLLDICDPDEGTNAWEIVIEGFVWPQPVIRSGSGEVTGTYMKMGQIHYDDVLSLLTQLTGTAQQLKDMLRKPAVRQNGLHIDGLDKLGGNAGLS